jgi:hypothetical protein
MKSMVSLINVIAMSFVAMSSASAETLSHASTQLRDRVCLGAQAQKLPYDKINARISYKSLELGWGSSVTLIIPYNDCDSPGDGFPTQCHYEETRIAMPSVAAYTWAVETTLSATAGFAPFRIEVTLSNGQKFREEGVNSGYDNFIIPFAIPTERLNQGMKNASIVPPEGFKALEHLGNCKL